MTARLAGLVALLCALCAGNTAAAVPQIDEPAPPLRGRLFSGEAFDLAALRGKVVLINFYSSYCSRCAYEIGLLETVYEENRARGLEVIAIGVDELADRHRVERMLRIYNLPGTMVQELTESGFAARYPTPTAFIVDRDGILRARIVGSKTPTHYRELILPLLQ